MGEVVNLRLARKAAARKAKEADAATNRAAYGRSRTERSAAKAETERTNRLLDGARREETD